MKVNSCNFSDPAWLTVVVSNIGKFCITSSFGIIYIFTTELFPTVVRSAGLGSASLCEGIASIIAPFTRELVCIIKLEMKYYPFSLYYAHFDENHV